MRMDCVTMGDNVFLALRELIRIDSPRREERIISIVNPMIRIFFCEMKIILPFKTI